MYYLSSIILYVRRYFFIGRTQQTSKKILDGYFSYLLCLLKNGQKSDSFAAHFKQHFNTTTSRTDLRKYMTFKAVKQLNPIGAMKTFTKPNCNICRTKHPTILKNLREKRVPITNKNFEIYGACRHKMTFHGFILSTDISVFNRLKGSAAKKVSNIMT